ncbi:MAG: hypothetical protein IPO21_04255 [Bacteroidales bacterium]|nr:hypothetical protein [Bacteroidales bacterium]
MIVDQDASRDNIYVYNLSGKSYSNIAQIELKYTPIKTWEFMAAYRLSDVKSTTNGSLKAEPLKNSYKAILNTSYSTPKQTWQFDFTAQFNGGGRMPEYSSHSYSSFSSYTIINAQITKKFKVVELYLGGENLTNFTQKDPVISADNPYSSDFDASTIWGPIIGRKLYLGFRLKIE